MNLTLESAKLEQAWDAFQEKKLNNRYAQEVLHDLGIPLITPEQTTLSEIQRAETPNLPILCGNCGEVLASDEFDWCDDCNLPERSAIK